MGQRMVRFSDMSGKEIPDGTGATVRVMWADARRTPWALDLTEDEAKQLFEPFARTVRRRRRAPRPASQQVKTPATE